jgi:hypothetical protein
MARNESDREDLLREASALVPRGELRVAGFPELLTVGYRVGGALSLYFGQDPVYQFDASGRLRRGFVEGLLYRSEPRTLARLQRVREEGSVVLLRHDLNAVELSEFRGRMQQHLEALRLALERGDWEVLRSVPNEPEGGSWANLLLGTLRTIASADPWLAGAIVGRRAGRGSEGAH